MLNLTLRQLRYFDALARHSHFGRAAESCSISQPALSMQIKELEEALGGLLLERNARQVSLTRFGEELAQRVRDILRLVDELGDFARASRDLLMGRLRIGMIPTIAPYLLPEVIGNLKRMHPELDIQLREVLDASSLSTLVQMVGAGMGVTLIPEMAVTVETRSASVSVARFKDPQPSRTVGMVWRKTSPLAGKLLQISEAVCHSADALRRQRHLP